MREGLRSMFFFGSMRDDRVREAVLGHPVDGMQTREAVLDDHLAMVVVGPEEYPVLRYAFGEQLDGKLVWQMTDADLERIEFWEDHEYGLAVMTVHVKGQDHQALVHATSKYESSRDPWDFAAFVAGVPEYLDEVREWMEKFDGE